MEIAIDLALVIKVFVLAVLQGVGEFLPISSSGHLLVLSRFFELPDAFTLSILLHAGTLASVLCFFYSKIIEVLRFRRRAILLVCVGSVPTVIIAAIIITCFGFLEESLATTGLGFLITACLLLFVLRNHCLNAYEEYYYKYQQNEDEDEPKLEAKTIETTTFKDAIIIGIAQGIAAIPGLSRSGTTISAAVARNLSRRWAAEFSFFLSIPVIAGAVLLEIIKVVKSAEDATFTDIFLRDPVMLVYLGGAVVSFIVGWVSLRILMTMLEEGKLHYFAYWLILAGLGTLAWSASIHWGEITSFFSAG